MKLKTLDQELSVCKVVSISDIDLNGKFFFIGKTDEEISLVCLTSDVPENTTDRVDGWRTFRIEGVLDFSLIGILSEISIIASYILFASTESRSLLTPSKAFAAVS